MVSQTITLHLIDGTYELFRNHFGAPPKRSRDGRQVGATLGLLRSMLMLVTSPGGDTRGGRVRPRH